MKKLALLTAILLTVSGPVSRADVVKAHFNGGVHWPTVPGSFEGMQKDTPQPHLTDDVRGWVIYNTDLLTGGRQAILIGETFAAPGFDFELDMGNLRFSKRNIHGLYDQNHATIQFNGNTFEGLFGNLDFVGSDGLDYRLAQSGFQWEMKRSVNGSTALQPIECSGYWNYQSISWTETLDYLPPHALISGAGSFSATLQELTFDGSGSYFPGETPATIIEHKWSSPSGGVGGGPQLTLWADRFDFEHPGDHIDLTLTVKDSFFQTGTADVEVYYGNTPPSIISAGATDNGMGGLVFSAEYADADLTSPQYLQDPDFEQLTLEFSYNGNVFQTGEGTVWYDRLEEVFGGEGDYLIFARATDLSGDFALKPVFITVMPEPGTLAALCVGGLAILRRRRGSR